ncbi:MAG: hypothetical protein ACRCT8_07060 [Lacipirellulaceae bacterium]
MVAAYSSPHADARRASARRSEPMWLPSGWLAVALTLVVSLSSWMATPAAGAETPGWRPRGAGKPVAALKHSATPAVASAKRTQPSVWGSSKAAVRPVSFEDDIAGPALASGELDPNGAERSVVRGYRVAQDAADTFGDALKDSLTRPFGEATEPETMPAPAETPAEPDNADRLFNELPAEPKPMEDAPADEPRDDYRAPDFSAPAEPRAEEVAPAPPANAREESDLDDIAAPLRSTKEDKVAKEREQGLRDCSEGLAALKAKRLDAINLAIGVAGVEGEDFPLACSIDDGTVHAPRCWSDVTYMWKAAALCHKPLYFEDVHLERYGHSWGPIMDPLVSGAHFFGTLPVLPYCMGLTPPNECVYTLGHYRPGSCAPYMIDPIPFTWRAALFQAGATVGAAAILP